MHNKKLLKEKIYSNIQAPPLFSVSQFSVFEKLNYSLVSKPPLPPLPAFRPLSLGPLRLLIINFSLGKTRELTSDFLK